MLVSVSLSSLSLVNGNEPIVYSDVRAITYEHFNRDAQLCLSLENTEFCLVCVSSVVVSVVFTEDLSMQFLTDYIRGSNQLVRLVVGRKCTPGVLRIDIGFQQSSQSEN